MTETLDCTLRERLAPYLQDLEAVAAKSLINCHCTGLDSIMLDDKPWGRVRMFLTQEHHEMWKNLPPFYDGMSIALHPHHCDLTLERVLGRVYNVVRAAFNGGGIRCELSGYKYCSQILTGKGGFVSQQMQRNMRLVTSHIDGVVRMRASDIHTVYVPKLMQSAWIVTEGAEDQNYKPYCWSVEDLEIAEFANLYKPMSVDYLQTLLNNMGWCE